jgi:hypothetical protein
MVKKTGDAGFIHEPTSGGNPPVNIVSWHDFGPYRIWAHSRSTDGGYELLSLEIELLGDERRPVDHEEKNARLNLAKLRRSTGTDHVFSATALRDIALGQVLDQHAMIVARQGMMPGKIENVEFRIVKEFDSKSVTQDELSVSMSVPTNGKTKLGANSRDSLLISKVYSQFSTSGNTRPAKSTAAFLQMDVKLVYVAVRIARKNGWLTSEGTGSSVGVLTELGKQKFNEIRGTMLLTNYLKGLRK